MDLEGAYREDVLPNGLTVVSEAMPHVRSVSVGMWVGYGSRHEPPAQGGTSHFIEHLLFKGTERRSARKLAEEIDSVGGQLNGFTAKEYTCYYCRVLDDHLELAVDLLSDMFLRSSFDPADVEKERGVVLEEIRLYLDAPDEQVHDLLAEAVWGSHALGRGVLGTLEEVAGLSRQAILAAYRQSYRPSRIILAAAGNLDHSRLVDLAARFFDAPPDPTPGPVSPRPQASPRFKLLQKDTEQVHICLGSEGVPLGDSRFYAFSVLSAALGGGSSSRLFQNVREDRGLVYSIYSYEVGYRDTGLLGIYAGTNPGWVGPVLEAARAEMRQLREAIRPEELARAKEQIKGGLLLGLESTSHRMTRLGKLKLLLHRVPTVQEVLDRIEAVTASDVKELAELVLDERRMALAVIGPVGEEVKGLWPS
ncbi:MAG: insulinase family protein [Acetobacteraceae bacterium]|nr:insulinase family protein [Acetobacteraceae bacterium]